MDYWRTSPIYKHPIITLFHHYAYGIQVHHSIISLSDLSPFPVTTVICELILLKVYLLIRLYVVPVQQLHYSIIYTSCLRSPAAKAYGDGTHASPTFHPSASLRVKTFHHSPPRPPRLPCDLCG